MSIPRISVYITSYNQIQFLIEAIESVLAQTLRPYEIIIVDDCSTDGSQEVISHYASRHPALIRAIYHSRNQGIPCTRNDALQIAQGDYVTFLDGDDRYLPTKLEKEIEALKNNPGAQLAYSNFYNIDGSGRRISIWADNESLPVGDIFAHTVTLEFPKKTIFRNELVEFASLRKVGLYDPKLPVYEDYDMRIRLTKRFQVACSYAPGLEYRRHEKGSSSLFSLNKQLDALNYLYHKNSILLTDLADKKRNLIKRKINTNTGNMIKIFAIEKIDKNRASIMSRLMGIRCLFRGIRYGLGRQDIRLAFKIVFPNRLAAAFLRAKLGRHSQKPYARTI